MLDEEEHAEQQIPGQQQRIIQTQSNKVKWTEKEKDREGDQRYAPQPRRKDRKRVSRHHEDSLHMKKFLTPKIITSSTSLNPNFS